MKIYPKEPDLCTIYRRIKVGEIDLQPDFQRDLVWNKAKKQSLIDTILREWQFPPVFMVVPCYGEKLEVLDGQQRLNAIYEFYEDQFEIDGNISPSDYKIKKLSGLKYSQLSKDDSARFDRYSIRVFEITDYKQDEPYELFFRLNQGSSLTPAEKRNTFYGPVRDQVRDLVSLMSDKQLNSEYIGFNNSRLSYHDVVARLLFALSKRMINKKITDSMLVDFFRSGQDVDNDIVNVAIYSISSLADLLDKKVRLNKPTLFTWLLFLSFEHIDRDTFYEFECMRENLKDRNNYDPFLYFIISLYREKSSISVNDAVPVQLRLLILYMVCLYNNKIEPTSHLCRSADLILTQFLKLKYLNEESLVGIMISENWGHI